MWTLLFWKDAGERAGRTFAQAVIAFWISGDVVGLFDVDVPATVSVAGMAALVSLLMSIGAGAVTSTPGASLVVEAIDPPGKHASK